MLGFDDATFRHRLVIIQTGDTATCFGCGKPLPNGLQGRGTSRWGDPKRAVHLCSDCCTVEALADYTNRGGLESRRDPYQVKAVLTEARRRGFI